MENMLNSRRNGKILSSYTENTLYCSDVYNFIQKLDNSVQIVKITVISYPDLTLFYTVGDLGTTLRLLVTNDGKLSRVGELSLAEGL